MQSHRSNVASLLWIFLRISSINMIQGEQTSHPFYIIAHMANTRQSIDWAIAQGANALENDFQFDDDGQPTVVEHGDPCDCYCAFTRSNICLQGLQRKCVGPKASNNAAAQLQYVARLKNIALYIVDSKVEAHWEEDRLIKAGEAIIPFLDRNLFRYGYRGKVIIGSGKIETLDYIKTAVKTANHSRHRDRYFFTFDGEDDDYQSVISTLSSLTNHRVYATGISACAGDTFYTAIQSGVIGRNNGENGLTYIWTIDKESSMREYINLGVQGIITNRVAVAKRVVTSMGLTLAKPSTPIPLSDNSVSLLETCDCNYQPGGCVISQAAPSGKACQCHYKLIWTCEGSLINCDISLSKCFKPDRSKASCELGQGDCDGY